ncbi:MAG: hypothetical protein K2M69_09995 [Muribaculaceae bacterium]|nr:hypothetical protein [Muribaculaceae bacterium]
MRKFLKAFLVMLLTSLSIQNISAVVNWRFQLGGMATLLRYKPEYSSTSRSFTLLFGSEIQIPVKDEWYIETGLNLRFGPTTFTYEQFDTPGNVAAFIPLKDFDKNGEYFGGSEYRSPYIKSGTGGFLDMPIRAGWKYILNEENEIQFSFGPYMSFALQSPSGEQYRGGVAKIHESNCFNLGLSPSVVFKHRALSVGIFYYNPCLYNGSKNRETNTLMFTIGLNFNGRSIDLDKLASGLEAASSVITTVNSSLFASEGMTNYSETTMSDYTPDTELSSGDNGNYEMMYRKWEQRAESCYNSLTLLGSKVTYESGEKSGNAGGPKKVSGGNYQAMKKSYRDAQKEMRKIREKARKAGVIIQKSKWETNPVSY